MEMSLIEQLGGYEYLNGFYKRAVAHGFTLTEIKEELLKHRRQHNIYEIGDKIVSTLDGSEDWKNTICEILAFHKKMAITTGFSCAIHHYDYRHATPEEIKAGRRL